MAKQTQAKQQSFRDFLLELMNESREQFKEDFKQIEPFQRLQMLEKMIQYVIPKCTNPTDVRGACFTDADVDEVSVADWNMTKRDVVKWYEKTDIPK